MRILAHRLVRSAVFVVAALWSCTAPACNVPVFRYALEHWETDPHQVVVFHRAPLPAAQQALVEALAKRGQAGLANLAVTRVDLTQDIPQSMRQLWDEQRNPTPPWMVVMYPRPAGISPSVWAGPLSAEAIAATVDSPARQDIAQKLLSGDAVVWLLLESGDQKLDDETARFVEAELRKLEKSLVLPERSAQDPPINPELPLKIAFSTLRVARTNPAERILVNMLVNWNTNLATATEPMLFPIFGRGRVLPPAIGSAIRPDALRQMAEFLTGACSCEVKEMNPGYDLLLAANWGSLPSYQEVVLPPPLVGMSAFAAAAATNPPASLPPQSRAAVVLAPTLPEPVGRGHLLRNLVAVLGGGLLFLATMTLVLRAKAGQGPR